MKKFMYSLISLFIISTFIILAQPKLQIVGGDTQDWKKVTPKDNPLQAKILLKNIGNQILHITNVQATCGCTTTSEPKKELNPGEETSFDVSLRIGSSSGPISKSIRIYSDDQENPTKHLTLKAEVVQYLEVLPNNYIQIQDMKVGEEKEQKFQIKNNTEKEITVFEFVPSAETISINIHGKKVIPPASSIEVQMKVKPDKAGRYNASVKFKSDHPDYPEVLIYGSGEVKESSLFNSGTK